MLSFNQLKNGIIELGRTGVEDLLQLLGYETISAGLACGICWENLEEAYQGCFDSEEEFAQELCESCGDIPNNLPHYIYIDWVKTARDIMFDYCEEKGHYFRIL